MLLRCLIFTLFGLAACLPAGAASNPLSGAHLVVLPNGLRLVHREHHSAPLVAIDLWVRAGSGRERPDENGAAHFLEHLLFKGTPTRKPGEIDAAIEDLGATLAAGTTRDGAHFHTTVSAEHAAEALGVIADAVQHATLDAAEMERERSVILDELARGQNDGRKQVTNALYADLFTGESRARPVLGTAESIRTLPRDTVLGFYRRWYAPNNATLVLVGDITPEAAEEMAKRNLGAWERRELPVDEAASGLPAEAVPAAVAPGPSWIATGVRTRTKPDADSLAIGEVVSRLIVDGDFGRLPQALKAAAEAAKPPVSRRPSAVITQPPAPGFRSVEAEFIPHSDGGVMFVSALADRANDAVYKTITQSLASFQKEGVTAEELDYARRRAAGAFLFDVETYAGQAHALGEADVLGDFSMAVDRVARLESVKPEDISDFASRWFDPARFVNAHVPTRPTR